MPKLQLKTEISAPISVVFDLSRSIDLHKISTAHTREEAVAGVTNSLIGMGETVTWRAKHFGIWHRLTSKITRFDRPIHFVDEMVEGPFKKFIHEHSFEEYQGTTVMTDVFDYESPYGKSGKLVDKLFLERYMVNFLERRNETIQHYAESDKWKCVMPKR